MVFQLVWRVRSHKQANGEPSRRPIEYVAPSWSWASVIGDIETEYVNTPDHYGSVRHLAKIVRVEIEKVGNTSFGQTTGGHLQLKGNTYKVTLKRMGEFIYDLGRNNITQGLAGRIHVDFGPLSSQQTRESSSSWSEVSRT